MAISTLLELLAIGSGTLLLVTSITVCCCLLVSQPELRCGHCFSNTANRKHKQNTPICDECNRHINK